MKPEARTEVTVNLTDDERWELSMSRTEAQQNREDKLLDRLEKFLDRQDEQT